MGHKTPWDGKQEPHCWLAPDLPARCVRGHLSGHLVVSASIFPILRNSSYNHQDTLTPEWYNSLV